MAADLAFPTRPHGPQHDAVPCAKTRYRSRTEEARGSNPLTSTPTHQQVRASSEHHRRRSPCSGAALGPRSIAAQLDHHTRLDLGAGHIERVEAVAEGRIGL